MIQISESLKISWCALMTDSGPRDAEGGINGFNAVSSNADKLQTPESVELLPQALRRYRRRRVVFSLSLSPE
jgi:hypothetical protein